LTLPATVHRGTTVTLMPFTRLLALAVPAASDVALDAKATLPEVERAARPRFRAKRRPEVPRVARIR
jgi:hypothetical protein